MKLALAFTLVLNLFSGSLALAQFVDTDPDLCGEQQVIDYVKSQYKELRAMGEVHLQKAWQAEATPTTGTRYLYKWTAMAHGAQVAQLCASCYATYALQEDYQVDTTGTYPIGGGYDDCGAYYDLNL